MNKSPMEPLPIDTTAAQQRMAASNAQRVHQQNATQEHVARVGIAPVALHSQRMHRLTIELPLERPKYRVAPVRGRYRIPTHVQPGHAVYLTVYPLEEHPEHPEFRRWICDHATCMGKHWTTEEELLAAHPADKVLRKRGELHCYVCVLEIPADGTRPASVHLLTPEAL